MYSRGGTLNSPDWNLGPSTGYVWAIRQCHVSVTIFRMGTAVRGWIRSVAFFRMGISVSEVAFGDDFSEDSAPQTEMPILYDSRREARSVKPVSDYLARFERRRCLFRDGMWCYIIA